MANRVNVLEQRLQHVENLTQRIIDAAALPALPPEPIEVWWEHVVSFYGDEETLFQRVKISKQVFLDCLTLVRDVTWERRGRQGAIRSNREWLFFRMTFLSRGISVLEVLVIRFIRSRDHIVRLLKNIATRFLPVLKAGLVRFFDERVPDVPGCSMIIDCTVCQVKKPALHFDDAFAHFSGKHSLYCLKKEVCLNIRSGTAAIISKSFPGSVTDIQVLRSHADEVNAVLAGSSMLADLGYRGVQLDVPTVMVCDREHILDRTRRVLVECYFGRLKMLWSVFATRWKLGEQAFDAFFDLACCFTNADVLRRPLREADKVFNDGVRNLVRAEREAHLQDFRDRSAQYRLRRNVNLGLTIN